MNKQEWKNLAENAVEVLFNRIWNGYNDAYNSVQAEYDRGVGDGWHGCIEENNLYERY